MNKWDSLFGGLMFTVGYICGAYSAPFVITILSAIILGATWAITSGWYDYRRGLLKISRARKTATTERNV